VLREGDNQKLQYSISRRSRVTPCIYQVPNPSQPPPAPAMQRFVVALVLLVSLALTSVQGDSDQMLSPPPRPAEFVSAHQLRTYLKALADYYQIMGRPRFGKRSDTFIKKDDAYSNDRLWQDFQ